MNSHRCTSVIMIGMCFALICLLCVAYSVGRDDGSIAEKRKFKMEQLKFVKPVHDFEEILRRLERIERALGIQP